LITTGSSILAITLTAPPHASQVVISILTKGVGGTAARNSYEQTGATKDAYAPSLNPQNGMSEEDCNKKKIDDKVNEIWHEMYANAHQ